MQRGKRGLHVLGAGEIVQQLLCCPGDMVPSSVLVPSGDAFWWGTNEAPPRELLPGLVDKFQTKPQHLDSGAAGVQGREQLKA